MNAALPPEPAPLRKAYTEALARWVEARTRYVATGSRAFERVHATPLEAFRAYHDHFSARHAFRAAGEALARVRLDYFVSLAPRTVGAILTHAPAYFLDPEPSDLVKIG